MSRLTKVLAPCAFYWAVAGFLATAQQDQRKQPNSAPSGDPTAAIPQVSLKFSEPKLLTINASPFIVDPMQCSADGKAFFEMVQNDNALRRSLYSVSAAGDVVSFDRITLPGLRNVQILSFFPGASHVVTLIFATSDNATTGNKDTPARGAYYLVVQDQTGQHTKVIELKLRIKPSQVAELDSGDFLVMGVEPVNKIPELELLDTDGSLLRILDVEGTKYENSQSIAKVFGDKLNTDPNAVLGWSHFIPWNKQVLLVQGGSHLPVFVIGGSSILRTVKVSIPPNMELESIIPMKANWLVRMRNTADLNRLAGQQVVYGTQSHLYEVNSDNGEIIKQILPPSDMRTNEIVCAADNDFIALHLIYKNKDDATPQLGLFTGTM
jgi:hypothetical protein